VHVGFTNDPDVGLDADAWNGGGFAVPHFLETSLRQTKDNRFARAVEILAFPEQAAQQMASNNIKFRIRLGQGGNIILS